MMYFAEEVASTLLDVNGKPKSSTFIPVQSDVDEQEMISFGDLKGGNALISMADHNIAADAIIPSSSSSSAEEKCAWLRGQVVGNDSVELETPFGRRRLTYADHTASGRCLHVVENFVKQRVLPFYGNTHTDDSFVGHRTGKTAREAAEYVKRCMGGGPDDALLFCGSGATAAVKRLQEVMGITVPSTLRDRVLSMKVLKPEERWVVFVGPYEHHSNLLSWRQSLAEVVEIGVDEDGLVDFEMLESELKSSKYTGRPLLGSFSACSNVTGIYTNTRALARLLHTHGAFACFDFAASGPYVQIDMRSGELEGYDAVYLSPHKFVGGPGTPGVLLMSKSLYHLRSHPPSTSGGGTVAFVNGYDEKHTLYHEDIEEREDAGTPAIIQKVRAALAFWVKEYMGYDLIDAREGPMIDNALQRLLPNPNMQVLGNTSVKRQAILSFLVHTSSPEEDGEKGVFIWRERVTRKDKPLHGRFVTKLLNDLFGIQARGGCACAGPYGHTLLGVDVQQSLAFRAAVQKGYHGLKPGWTRVSFAYYMSIAEFEFILAAIEFIGIYGQRFLPLYHFNWKTGDWTPRKLGALIKKIPGDVDKLTTAFGRLMKLQQQKGSDQEAKTTNHNVNDTAAGTERKYATYLETALILAKSLPKFPPSRPVPEDVDPSLILFRI
ncbi:hypothetical protein H6P81_008203 [Aristolochia fimbriata]|uniref:Aminotransferase class V domain-containing protein n=1 Tax=Aristolochia fimbriata TaxID=158543 RepID=A0AAV7F3K6_ARIFI|nr:hypothetical protein H6P81_008203 [Aristolochia fimbriata]